MKITIIGNVTNPNGEQLLDGASLKVALYEKVLVNEGYDVSVIELINWKKRPIMLIHNIRNSVINSDIVLIMGGPKGSRVVIPLCNFFNKNKRTRLVYPMIGTGTLNRKIRHLSVKDVKKFLKSPKDFNISDKRIGRNLAKLDVVMPENELLSDCYRKFYGLKNVVTITNFRQYDYRPLQKKILVEYKNKMKFAFFSRVSFDKGIFDAITAIQQINDEAGKSLCILDIYGELQLNEDEKSLFMNSLNDNIQYKGVINNENALIVLSEYDFLIFSTHLNEGTPGTITEALIAGVPVISSNYPHVSDIIKEGYNGFIFELGNVSSLKAQINNIFSLPVDEINIMNLNAYESGNQFTYEFNRKKLLSLITGENQTIKC